MQTVLILGRQPALGLAELESLYGADAVRPVSSYAAVVEAEKVDFTRLGGSVKAAASLHILESTNWEEIQSYLEQIIPDRLKGLPKGKFRLGISTYGFDIKPQKIMATGLNLKKVIRLTGRSVRLVPNKEMTLNSAQVIHNKLTEPLGWELLLIKDGSKTIIARTTNEQDIEAYTLRDRGRPKRDARVGMLPPKLAQIIINLAASKRNPNHEPLQLLDPFCGTGVIVLEALLMGFNVTGADIDPRMTAYTSDNVDWLRDKYREIDTRPAGWGTQQADATHMTWMQSQAIYDKKGIVVDAKLVPMQIDLIASEVYLGRPFTSPPEPEILARTIADCNLIIKKFLKNVHGQILPGTRLSLAVPAWAIGQNSKFHHLPLLDSLGEIGYNRIDFRHASAKDLVYYRDGQIVGRELLVLVRS